MGWVVDGKVHARKSHICIAGAASAPIAARIRSAEGYISFTSTRTYSPISGAVENGPVMPISQEAGLR